mmetsp:Transcript_40003/g.96529  ORF Transcript_40003/g.96529 Transcript_40003/m.96529 type:complete len:103 (+) Transcript_40003:5419-5727(+)
MDSPYNQVVLLQLDLPPNMDTTLLDSGQSKMGTPPHSDPFRNENPHEDNFDADIYYEVVAANYAPCTETSEELIGFICWIVHFFHLRLERSRSRACCHVPKD